MNASKKTWLCNKEAFIFNCPKTCDVCNVDDGGNGKDDDGNTSTSLECSGEAPDCCMGLTNTCDLRIDELFFAAMHNANSDENKWNSNHKAPLELALQEGFRAFYLDVCLCNGQIVFCHGNCFWAGTQDPTEVFKNVVAFLKDNPSELVIFNFEISYGNPTPLQLWDVMKQVNGLKNKSYIHHGGGWPKLKGLLQSGKQIISLKHNGNGCLDTASSGCTPYIQEFFKYTVGTKYDFNSISEIEDVQNSCVGERGTAYQQKFFAINNFVTTDFPGPTEGASTTLNQESFMKNRITQCEKKMGRNANFFAVDFWQHGKLHTRPSKPNIRTFRHVLATFISFSAQLKLGDVPKVAKEINMERGARR